MTDKHDEAARELWRKMWEQNGDMDNDCALMSAALRKAAAEERVVIAQMLDAQPLACTADARSIDELTKRIRARDGV